MSLCMATVQSMINKHKRYNTAKNLSGRGRKHKVSPKLARKICREVNNNPRTTTKALFETLDQAETKVSRSTIERVLHRGGLHGRRPRKTPRPLLRKKLLDARLAFAWGHLKQDSSFWSTSCGLMRRSWSYLDIWMLNTSGGTKEKHTSRRKLCSSLSMVVET